MIRIVSYSINVNIYSPLFVYKQERIIRFQRMNQRRNEKLHPDGQYHTLQPAICFSFVVQQITHKFKIQKVDKMEEKRQRNSYLSFRVT
jgi:hypothetical protein